MLREIVNGVKTQIGNRVLNREKITELALAAFFAGGHVLLTGPSGLGKTVWAGALAQAMGLSFKKELFMHDYPSEPSFSQVYMAKQIASAPSRAKSSLLEAMDDQAQFFIIATMDEGQILPEPLKDRFMLSLNIAYPGIAAEKQLLMLHNEAKKELAPYPVCNQEAIQQAKREVAAITVEEPIFNYIISIVETTRRVGAFASGASPRGSKALLEAAKVYAAIHGRDYCTTDDVRNMAPHVLRHRVKLQPEAIQEGLQVDTIIEGILAGRKT